MSLTLDGTSGITSSGGTNVLQADAVITANLQNGSVTTAKIADLGVTEGKLANSAVATAKIADNAVTTAKINNAAVTIAKLSATGTADSTTYLRGDGSWQTINTTPPTDFDVVGTYVVAYYTANSLGIPGGGSTNHQILSRGSTVAGSTLRVNSRASSTVTNPPAQELQKFGPWASVSTSGSGTTFPTTNSVTLSGTWRFMAAGTFVIRDESGTSTWIPGLWVRIS